MKTFRLTMLYDPIWDDTPVETVQEAELVEWGISADDLAAILALQTAHGHIDEDGFTWERVA